jgi:hypothetical protein
MQRWDYFVKNILFYSSELSSGMYCRVLPPSSGMMMEAVRTSETSVDTYFAWQYIPEDKSELHTHHRENLKSHILLYIFNS